MTEAIDFVRVRTGLCALDIELSRLPVSCHAQLIQLLIDSPF